MTLSVGDKRGEWTVVEVLPLEHQGTGTKRRARRHVMVRCSCGAVRKVKASNIEEGLSRSCGHNLKDKHRKVMSSILEHEKKDPNRLIPV